MLELGDGRGLVHDRRRVLPRVVVARRDDAVADAAVDVEDLRDDLPAPRVPRHVADRVDPHPLADEPPGRRLSPRIGRRGPGQRETTEERGGDDAGEHGSSFYIM